MNFLYIVFESQFIIASYTFKDCIMDIRKRKPSDEIEIDQQKSNDYLINIKDLPKEQVLIALFKNVYKKSAASKTAWHTIVNLYYPDPEQKAPIGSYNPPTKYEAEDILKKAPKHKKIDYIGAVMFQMDFSADEID